MHFEEGDYLHEMSKLIFWEKNRKTFLNVICWIFNPAYKVLHSNAAGKRLKITLIQTSPCRICTTHKLLTVISYALLFAINKRSTDDSVKLLCLASNLFIWNIYFVYTLSIIMEKWDILYILSIIMEKWNLLYILSIIMEKCDLYTFCPLLWKNETYIHFVHIHFVHYYGKMWPIYILSIIMEKWNLYTFCPLLWKNETYYTFCPLLWKNVTYIHFVHYYGKMKPIYILSIIMEKCDLLYILSIIMEKCDLYTFCPLLWPIYILSIIMEKCDLYTFCPLLWKNETYIHFVHYYGKMWPIIHIVHYYEKNET